MIDPNKIDPIKLPYMPFSDFRRLPKCRVVYFAISQENTVLYVGKAWNLRHRWRDHHRIDNLQQMNCVRIAWIECDKNILDGLEQTMIEKFVPPLNWRNKDYHGTYKRIVHTVFLDPKQRELIKKLSMQTKKSCPALIREAIRDFLEKQGYREREQPDPPAPSLDSR